MLGITRDSSFVDITRDDVVVRMAWGFRATIPRAAIRSARHDHDRILGWGVHGWRGKWLVNGSSSNIVRIEIEPEQRGRVLGIPVRLHALRVSAEQPDDLISALTE